jgi:hypothetical membrane protein
MIFIIVRFNNIGGYIIRTMRYLPYLGIISMMIGWITIVAAILINPWFNFMEGALSDLGALNVANSYVFNSGLALSGILAMAYAIYLALSIGNKVATFGSGVFFIASSHLLLIAVFPEGTEPHAPVSYEFFLLMAVSILIFGIAMLLEGSTKYGLLNILYFAIGLGGSVAFKWPSIALLETYNIVFMTAWAITVNRYCTNEH